MTTTYGKKKKKAIFPSFSSLQGEDNTAQQELEKLPNRVPSMMSLSSLGNANGRRAAPGNDDSIDEMANVLLDDTTSSHKDEAGIGSFLSADHNNNLQIRSHPTQTKTTEAPKTLPQLPQFLFNGDDAWASKNATVVTAIGRTNTIDFSNLENESSNMSSQHLEDTDISPPPIPKRSSKRKSLQSKAISVPHPKTKVNDNSKVSSSFAGHITKCSISAPLLLDIPRSSSLAPVDHVARILEANRAHAAREIAEREQLEGSLIPTKKRRMIDGKVFDKMKTAFSKQLRGKVTKETDRYSTKSLLDSSTNELQGTEDLIGFDSREEWQLDPHQSPMKTSETSNKPNRPKVHQRPQFSLEIRSHKGTNFSDAKTAKVIAPKNIPRKALPIDRESDKTRKLSLEDLFTQPHSKDPVKTPTEVSIEFNEKHDDSLESRLDYLVTGITSSESVQDEISGKQSMDGFNLDTVLSSSPLAQSTPRIRLEPMFQEYGKTTLKKDPVNSASVFDYDASNDLSDMEVDDDMMRESSSVSGVDRQQRRKTKAFSLAVSNKVSEEARVVTTKKHPSPTRSMWDDLRKGQVAPYFQLSGDDSTRDPPMIGGMLGSKDSNQAITKKKRQVQKKPEMTTSVKSFSNILDTQGSRSTTDPKSKRNGLFPRRVFSSNNVEDDDLDELQWDWDV